MNLFGPIDIPMYFDTPLTIYENIFVADGGVLDAPIVYIDDTLTIENYGKIVGTINVCDNCTLTIENAGVFNATFDLGDNAEIVQLVNSSDDLTHVRFNTNYTVVVDGANNINLGRVVDAGDGAETITIKNSVVNIDVANIDATKLRFDGVVGLRIDNLDEFLGRPILNNIKSDVFAYIDADISNSMFSVASYVDDDDLYVKMVRETDYTKFMPRDIGGFINSLRGTRDAESVLYALDGANTRYELNQIMADSMRIAPINLMRPVRMFNAFSLFDFDSDTGLGATYIMTDDLYMYGPEFNVGIHSGDFDFGIRGYVNYLNQTDGYDKATGIMYGGDIYAKYIHEYGFVRGLFGMNFTKFNMDHVFDGTRAVSGPVGMSTYAALDVGYFIDSKHGGYIAPFVGAMYENIKILYQNESDFVGRVGMDAGYRFDVLGINYDYSLKIATNALGNLILGGGMRFMSNMDMIGGHLDFGYTDNKIGRGYKITAGIDLKF